jgi:hypothetical protein
VSEEHPSAHRAAAVSAVDVVVGRGGNDIDCEDGAVGSNADVELAADGLGSLSCANLQAVHARRDLNRVGDVADWVAAGGVNGALLESTPVALLVWVDLGEEGSAGADEAQQEQS